MKMILRIIKLQLSSLFSSPVAWIVLFMCVIICTFNVTSFLEGYYISQSITDGRVGELTKLFLIGRYNLEITSYYGMLRVALFIFIPLITMGIVSGEKNSGTIKLLYSSPVKLNTIILGKYIATLLYILLLITLVFLISLPAYYIIESFDINLALTGLFVLFLLAATYAAIGIYISSLSSYPIVDIIATVAILGFLDLIYQYVKEIPIVSEVFYWLSLSKHTDLPIKGLVTTGDVAYFIIIIMLFLALASFKLNGERMTKSERFFNKIKIATVIVLVFISGYFFTRPQYMVYLDVTQNKSNTLSTELQEVLKTFDKGKGLTLTNYANVLRVYQDMLPTRRVFDLENFQKYRRFLPYMKIDYKYFIEVDNREALALKSNDYFKKRLEKSMEQLKIDENDVLFLDDLIDKHHVNPADYDYYSFRMLSYKDKMAYVKPKYFKTGSDFYQKNSITAFMKLKDETIRVGYLKDHRERVMSSKGLAAGHSLTDNWASWIREIGDYSNDRSFLNNGSDVEPLSFNDYSNWNIDLLFIVDPIVPYNSEELEIIKNYLDDGGDLLLAASPNNRDVFNTIASYVGIEMIDGIIKQTDSNLIKVPDVIPGFVNPVFDFKGGYIEKNYRIALPIITGALINKNNKGFKVAPLLIADKKSTKLQSNQEKEEISEPLVMAYNLEKQLGHKTQRILTLANADVFSFNGNKKLGRTKELGVNFLNNRLSVITKRWFTYNKIPVEIEDVESKDTWLKTTMVELRNIKIISLYIIPAFIALLGVVTFIRRKRA